MRYLYLYPRSVPRILDIFFWPMVELLIWGFLTLYLQQSRLAIPNFITALLGALIFWNFIQRSQQAVSIAFLEEVWERNLLNIFVTPLRISEFLIATVFVGIVRLILIGLTLGVLAYLLFKFNIFFFGFLLIPFILNLFLFGWILGLLATSIIMRFGQSAQVLAFALTLLLQPFMAVFYPVSVLPKALQYFANLIPATHVFEGMRVVVFSGQIPLTSLFFATVLNIVWFIIAIIIFFKMFDYILETGQLMKLVD
ncbi:ABC transporter permease [Candidatus Daviesbacteria bacterium]|nr:ABC transporter permease [Candidatus Daviesbacteria bacterium]